MASDIEQIRDTAGDYRKWALAARAKYIALRLRQDPEIKKLYTRLVKSLAKLPMPSTCGPDTEDNELLKEQATLLADELANC